MLAVQHVAYDVFYVGQHQSLKGLHDYKCKGNRPGFLGDWDGSWEFEPGVDFTQLLWSVKGLSEDRSQQNVYVEL